MRILRLQLRNVKSYGDEPETIEFADGVNFIAGPNGAGKSTQMEAIGYALFDTCPYTRDDFVRRGAKTGTIAAWFEDGGQEFRVERKFGAANSWTVQLPDGGALEGSDDVVRFLCDRFHVADAEQLHKVYENIVGVQQGTFTALFKMQPAHRRKILDNIINVDAYRDAADARKDVKGKHLTSAVAAVDRRIAEANAFLDEHRGDPAALQKVVASLAELDQVMAGLTGREGLLKARATRLAALQAQRDELDRDIATTGARLEELRRLLAAARMEEAQAERAESVVRSSAEGHAAWEVAERDLAAIEPRRGRRDEITTRRQKSEARLQEIGLKIGTLDGELKALTAARAAVQQSLDAATSLVEQKRAAAQVAASSAVTARTKYAALDSELDAFEARRHEFTACLERVREVDAEIIALGTPADAPSADDARQLLAGLQTRLAELEADRSHLAQQICPFLLEACDRVSPDVFARQMESLRPQIATADENVARALAAERLRDRLADAGRARSKEIEKARTLREPRDGDFERLALEWKQEAAQRLLALQADGEAARVAQDDAVRAQADAGAATRELEAQQKALESIGADLASKTVQRAALAKSLDRDKIAKAECELKLKDYAALDDEYRDAVGRRTTHAAAHDAWLKHANAAAQLVERRDRVRAIGDELAQAAGRLEYARDARAGIVIDDDDVRRVGAELGDLHGRLTAGAMDRQHLQADRAWLESIVSDMTRRKAAQDEDARELRKLDRFRELLDDVWAILRDAGPRISLRLLHGISARANRILDAMQDEPSKLAWGDDYQVKLRREGGELPFHALSGGEQMSVALAIQMAMARVFARSSFCVFDEPTVHLDEARKERLARAIKDGQEQAKFRQVFVVSHDDTFARFVDHEIQVTKQGNASRVV